MPDPVRLPDLPLFSANGGSQLTPTWSTSAFTASLPGVSNSIRPTTAGQLLQSTPGFGYDLTAALPPKLVRRILDLEFVEMAELLPDTWQEESAASEPGHPHRQTRRPLVTEILPWLECFGRLAAVLCTKYPEKAAEFWAYQTSIIRAARNFEGTAWVAYDRQESLARRDLNWSACNARLYNEAFTGRAKAIPRCQHCLSEAHGSLVCPLTNPDPVTVWQPISRATGSDSYNNKRPEICQNYEGRCKFQRCKYLHICKECYYPHPWTVAHGNQSASQQRRSRSPRRPHHRVAPFTA